MGFQVMLCLGPLALTFEILFKGAFSQWFKYTLSLGLVNTIFNVLDQFMDRNMQLIVGNNGWENAATTWETVQFDIIMVAMYIMAFRLIGKVLGDGSGGALSSKVITMMTMLGAASIAGAAAAPGMAAGGGKSMMGMRGRMMKGIQNRKARKGMRNNLSDGGGE